MERCLGRIAIGCFLATCGCGESGPVTVEVTGTVTYQGEPLPTGRVTFVSVTYRPTSSVIDKNGQYRMDSVLGTHAVEVVANRTIKEEGFEGLPEYEPIIPSRFNRAKTSGVQVTVEDKQPNVIDIKLE